VPLESFVHGNFWDNYSFCSYGVRIMNVKIPNGINHEGEPKFIDANAEFVDGVLTEEDRKKIDELLKKIAEENQ
jgi:hypothetical protein